jgi:hypothetical protein
MSVEAAHDFPKRFWRLSAPAQDFEPQHLRAWTGRPSGVAGTYYQVDAWQGLVRK